MEDLNIKGGHGTYFTPTVIFNATTGKCSISGESYLEDSFEFYDNLSKWINDYFASGSQEIVLDIRLTYFNTSSSRAILDMLRVLKSHLDKGKSVIVNWHYPDPDDDEMLLEAEDFMDDSKLKMNLIAYPI
jgi:SiaC family regulatory phosphoprotein